MLRRVKCNKCGSKLAKLMEDDKKFNVCCHKCGVVLLGFNKHVKQDEKRKKV